MAIDSKPIPTQVSQYTDAEAIAAVEAEATLALTGTQSGLSTTGNLQFPAVAVPSADPNAFDDYEEGTWTPVATFATPGDVAVAYSVQEGYYRKTAGLVWVQFRISLSTFTHSTASGSLQITGIPFAPLGVNNRGGGTAIDGYTKSGFVACAMHVNSDHISFMAQGSGVYSSGVYAADMSSGIAPNFSGIISYRVT